MSVYNHKSLMVSINGYEITAFDESADALSIAPVGDDGAWTFGANGRGVYVFSGNQSGILTLKLLQHSADNHFYRIYVIKCSAANLLPRRLNCISRIRGTVMRLWGMLAFSQHRRRKLVGLAIMRSHG